MCSINVDPPSTALDQDRPRILPTVLILALPEQKSTTTVWNFACDTEQPTPPSLHADDGAIATTSDSPSFLSRLADGLVVFTFSVEYYDNDTADISDVKFVIHRQSLSELLSCALVSTAETTSEAPNNKALQMVWSEWGPSRTRWLDIHGGSAAFPPMTWGQRVVVMRPRYDSDNSRPIYIYNFNPAAVSAAASTASSDVVTSLDPLNLNEDWAMVGSSIAFQETVWSQLPYIRSESPFSFGGIGGAMMDGDRIVLLRVGFVLPFALIWLWQTIPLFDSLPMVCTHRLLG